MDRVLNSGCGHSMLAQFDHRLSANWKLLSGRNGQAFLRINNVINNEDKELFLLGDFNKKLLNEETDRHWGNFTTSLGLSQLVSEVTRVTKDSATLIDHIYTNYEGNVQCVNVKKLCLSDHYAVFCNRKCISVVSKNLHQVINYRSFKYFDEAEFLIDLSCVPWEIIQNFDTVDDMVSVWNYLFLETLNKHAPMKSHRINKKYQPDWLTPEILDAMKERNKYKLNGNIEMYKVLRNKVSGLIEKSKKESYQSKIEDGQTDPRTIWKLFKELGANQKGGNDDPNLNINVGDRVITDENDLTDVFNSYFVNVASNCPIKFRNSK